ncbi:MAG: hypothetical protein C5S49_06585 [Candidatus Methanogaster sp.]|nr:MAG: hypothetical protein C5S49_06585 [ANME-2 cluster archaeon]
MVPIAEHAASDDGIYAVTEPLKSPGVNGGDE